MLIIGTAGHIDHGKSSIVKRLTNVDPDRLPEEKERGMTIDLGFAFYKTDKEETVGFVDVPGHERFVKNMIAGVGGIDLVMLVIAADDGWMPQSEEHFQIVRLLNIKNGIIVINKSDLAENDWLELLEAEVAEKVKGSFLEDAPIFKVSAQTGDGFEKLQDYLNELPDKIKSKNNIKKTRLYIDRSFVRQGIGGVVTGTLRGGNLQIGQNIDIFPSLEKGKVRTLQSNKQEVDMVTPGHRTAVSVTGIEKEKLVRGGVLSSNIDVEEIYHKQYLALSLSLLEESKIAIADRRKVVIIIGTTEVEGEIRLYDKKNIKPGENGIIFFKPDEPLFSLIGDFYIMRLPTPMVTLGGGQVLDRMRHFPKKKELEKYSYLNKRIPLSLGNLILSELDKKGIAAKDNILADANFSPDDIQSETKKLLESNQLTSFENNIISEMALSEKIKNYQKKITTFLKDKSHLSGLLLEQLKDLLNLPESQLKLIIRYMTSKGTMVKVGDVYSLSGQKQELAGPVKKAFDEIMRELQSGQFRPPSISSFTSKGKPYKDAIKFILDNKLGYKCGSEFIFVNEVWEEIVGFVKDVLNKNNELIVADLKDQFSLSRKYTIPILEETDRIRLTERDGDVRVKGRSFEN